MTRHDDIRRRVGVLSGDKLTVKVSPEAVSDDNSFRSVSSREGEDDVVTVALEAEFTRLNVKGVDATFDGYRYFPRDPDEYDVDYRGDVGDAAVDFDFRDVEHVTDRHPVRNLTVAALVEGFERGTIEVLPKADD